MPISSSGHLVLAQYFMDIDERGVIFEVIVHMGTLTSILIYYRDDLLYLIKCTFNGMDEARTYLFHLGVSTVPCVLVALLFDKFIESAFLPSVVIPMLLIKQEDPFLVKQRFSVSKDCGKIPDTI